MLKIPRRYNHFVFGVCPGRDRKPSPTSHRYRKFALRFRPGELPDVSCNQIAGRRGGPGIHFTDRAWAATQPSLTAAAFELAQATVPPTGMMDAQHPMPMNERYLKRFPQPARVLFPGFEIGF